MAGGVVEVGERKARFVIPEGWLESPNKNIGKREKMMLKRGLTNQK